LHVAQVYLSVATNKKSNLNMNLKQKFAFTIAFFAMAALLSMKTTDEWVPLLDKDLTQWDTYLSYRHQVGYNGIYQ